MTYLNLKVGDEVGVARYGRHSILFAAIGVVEKINSYGHIFVKVPTHQDIMKFDKHGNSYKNNYGPTLVGAASLRVTMALDNKRKERNSLARQIEKTMQDGWSYGGEFHADEDRIAELKRLVAALEETNKSCVIA